MVRAISECGGLPLSTSHAHAPRHMDIRRWGASAPGLSDTAMALSFWLFAFWQNLIDQLGLS